MAELVDAYVSGAYFERSAGSSPVSGTRRFSHIVLFYNSVVQVAVSELFVPKEYIHISGLIKNTLKDLCI